MRASSRNRGVVKAVSPDTSLIEEDDEIVATPSKGIKTEKKSSVVKDENENKFTLADKPVQLKTVVSSPKRSLKTTITVTPLKDDENQPVKSSKKGAFGRLIFLDDDGCAIGPKKTATVVTKASRLVNVVYRYHRNLSTIDTSSISERKCFHVYASFIFYQSNQ
jgi:hypothetical protein